VEKALGHEAEHADLPGLAEDKDEDSEL